MNALPGRKALVHDLARLILEKQAILLYGPVGIGKSSILENVRQIIDETRKPWGISRETRTVSDLTEALLGAYPEALDADMGQLRLRSALLAANRDNPGVLFLDHVHNPGTQFKGLLRSLNWAGMGMLIAADAEGPRDHGRIRAMHFTWREKVVAPLSNRYISGIMDDLLMKKQTLHTLKKTDRIALIRMARGRPGWVHMIMKRLQRKDFWDGGNVLLANVRISIITEIADRYLEPVDKFLYI